MPEPLTADLWRDLLRPFEKEQQKGYFGKSWTWTSGGCFAFASAFQAAFGGEFYGVCRVSPDDCEPELPVDHALVFYEGQLYDHEGVFDVSSLKPNQVLKERGDHYVFWFEDEFFGDEDWAAIHAIMRECAVKVAQASISSPTP